VLDSIVGPTITWYDHNILQDKEHQRRFDAFAAWTAKADSVYHLGTDAATVKQKYYQVEAAGHEAVSLARTRGIVQRCQIWLSTSDCWETPMGPVTFRASDGQSTMGAWVGTTKLDAQRGVGIMVNHELIPGEKVLPSDEDVKKLRPAN